MTEKQAMEFQKKLRKQLEDLLTSKPPTHDVLSHTVLALAHSIVEVTVHWVGIAKAPEYISRAVNICMMKYNHPNEPDFDPEKPPKD